MDSRTCVFWLTQQRDCFDERASRGGVLQLVMKAAVSLPAWPARSSDGNRVPRGYREPQAGVQNRQFHAASMR